MASTIKRRVMEALAAEVAAAAAPDVKVEDVVVVDAGADRPACFPHVVVTAGPFTFHPFDEDELWSSATQLVNHVGDLSGRLTVELGFTSQGQREAVEARVLHRFLNQVGRRGVLVAQLDGFDVGGQQALFTTQVAFALDEETWVDEMVFERKRYSRLTVSVDMPALALQTDVYDVDQLVQALTEDLESDVPDEQVAVDEDGDLSVVV